MTQTVTMPDGTVHNFPDEATPEQITQALSNANISPIQSAIAGANDMLSGGFDDELRGLGHALAAKMQGQPSGNLISSGIDRARAERDVTQQANPNSYLAGQVGGAILPALFTGGESLAAETGLGTKALQGMAKGAIGGGIYGLGSSQGDIQDRAPDALSSAALGGIIGGSLPIAGTALEKIGQSVENSGVTSKLADKAKYVQDLITPKLTSKVANEQFANSVEKGLFKTRVNIPTPQEQEVVDTVSAIPAVKSGNSLLKNYNIINDTKNAEAQKLANHLAKNDVAIDGTQIEDALSKVKENLSSNPYLTGDGQKASEKVINAALGHITNNDLTASGLLQARKDFDKWVSQYKKNAFDPATLGPVTDAIQQVRQAINGVVADAVPDANVKQSLRLQSNLYRAMDNIETKGGAEGKNIFARAGQKFASGIPGKTILGKIASTAAAGGALSAGAATGLPVATAAALYGLGKLATAPTTRIITGGALSKMGSAAKRVAR